jgi:UDP-N-acetylmuramoylalanine--D-glutamate ligase
VKALVYGLARSGLAARVRLEARGDDVVSVDGSLGNEDDLALLDGVQLVVKSPGVPGERPLVEEARRRKIPVWSEVELGWTLLAPEGTRFVGVTGTNGKTTTAELLGAIFRAAGREVAVAGNVGTPLSSIAAADWVVCEVSSFQLEDVHAFACEVAVLLNLEPDHLDRHGTFEAYRAAKLRILERAGVAVVPRGLGLEGIEFSAGDPLPAEPLIRGAHNRENAAAATAAARAAGIGDEAIAEGLRTFPGVPHRLEPVGEACGVRYVNDSKATNVAAALRGLAAYSEEPVHLILGGSPKGESFEPLVAAIGANVRSVHLVGAAGPDLAAAIGSARAHEDGTLARAVAHAAALAEPGSVVLLSPACASYDQYANFERRGEEFKRLVAELA